MRYLIAAAALVLAASLSACSTFGPTGQQQAEIDQPRGAEASVAPGTWSPPNYAGITAGRLVIGEGGLRTVEFISGKEAEDVTITFEKPDGTKVTYDAKGLKAFEGQLARAEVERALAGELADLWENIAPEIKTGLVEAVCLYVTKAPCG